MPARKKPNTGKRGPSLEPAIDAIVLLIVSGMTASDLANACSGEDLKLTPPEAEAAIAAARGRIRQAAMFDSEFELGVAITRCNDIYRRALEGGDTRTALNAQKEINRLLKLSEPDEEDADAAAVRKQLELTTGATR